MALISFSVKHHRNPEEAKARLADAVEQARRQYGPMIQRVEWSPDRDRCTITAPGATAEMTVDTEHVHASVDVAMLGGLLGGRVAQGLKEIVQKQLT